MTATATTTTALDTTTEQVRQNNKDQQQQQQQQRKQHLDIAGYNDQTTPTKLKTTNDHHSSTLK